MQHLAQPFMLTQGVDSFIIYFFIIKQYLILGVGGDGTICARP